LQLELTERDFSRGEENHRGEENTEKGNGDRRSRGSKRGEPVAHCRPL